MAYKIDNSHKVAVKVLKYLIPLLLSRGTFNI